MERSANKVILGYFYQFDRTILEVLECKSDSDFVEVEGIEDIDISTATEKTAVQCKYYSSTKYQHSVIAKPIRQMLLHYKTILEKGGTTISYKLYGYYKGGQDKLILPLSIDRLKRYYLKYNGKFYNEELQISDETLESFLSLLTIDINAQSYDEQLNNIISLLREEFKCECFDAEYFYYNNALRVIKELSIENNTVKRRITRDSFIKRINIKKILFDTWFVQYKGEKKYFGELRKQYFSNLNTSPFERFFLIEAHSLISISELKQIVFAISRKWTKISKRETTPFCAYLYLHNLTDQNLINLKSELFSESFRFNDGFPYHGSSFTVNAIMEEATYHNQLRIKIINKLENLDEILALNKKTKEIYQFFYKEPFYDSGNISAKHIRIQIKSFNNVEEII